MNAKISQPEALIASLVSVPEAAQMLGVSTSTIWRWIDKGILPACRIGPKRVRIERSAIGTVTAGLNGKSGDSHARVALPRRGERRMTLAEQAQMFAAIERANQLRRELFDARRGVPFASSLELLYAARDERTEQLG